jgi:hypothetical protein
VTHLEPFEVDYGVHPSAWAGRHINVLPFFPQLHALFTAIAMKKRVRLQFTLDGTQFQSARLGDVKNPTADGIVGFLEFIRRTREVCEKVGINPIFPKEGVPVEDCRTIEQLHALLFVGQLITAFGQVEICFSFAPAPSNLTLNDSPQKLVILNEERFVVLGEEIKLGTVENTFTEMVLKKCVPSADGQSAEVVFRGAPTCKRVMRLTSEKL